MSSGRIKHKPIKPVRLAGELDYPDPEYVEPVDAPKIPERFSQKVIRVLKRSPIIPILSFTSIFIPRLRPMLTWLKERLSEKSTYQGMIGMSAAMGVSLNPEMMQAIIALAVAALSFIEVARKEKFINNDEK